MCAWVRRSDYIQYLIIGTGKACAWHVSASVEVAALRTPSVTASDVNDGAFDPTGSTEERKQCIQKYVSWTECRPTYCDNGAKRKGVHTLSALGNSEVGQFTYALHEQGQPHAQTQRDRISSSQRESNQHNPPTLSMDGTLEPPLIGTEAVTCRRQPSIKRKYMLEPKVERHPQSMYTTSIRATGW